MFKREILASSTDELLVASHLDEAFEPPRLCGDDPAPEWRDPIVPAALVVGFGPVLGLLGQAIPQQSLDGAVQGARPEIQTAVGAAEQLTMIVTVLDITITVIPVCESSPEVA